MQFLCVCVCVCDSLALLATLQACLKSGEDHSKCRLYYAVVGPGGTGNIFPYPSPPPKKKKKKKKKKKSLAPSKPKKKKKFSCPFKVFILVCWKTIIKLCGVYMF